MTKDIPKLFTAQFLEACCYPHLTIGKPGKKLNVIFSLKRSKKAASLQHKITSDFATICSL